MWFTWVTLPVLIATLAAAGSVQAAPPGARGAEDDPDRAWTIDVPIAIRTSRGFEAEAVALLSDRATRCACASGTDVGREATEVPSTAIALVQLRTTGAERLVFSARLSRTLTGFFPFHTTACPPPAGA